MASDGEYRPVYLTFWSARIWPWIVILVLLLVATGWRCSFAWAPGLYPWPRGLLSLVYLLLALAWRLRLRRKYPYLVMGRETLAVPGGSHRGSQEGFLQGLRDHLGEIPLRFVRLADVASWSIVGPDVTLTLRSGESLPFTLDGLRPADRERVRTWLVEKLGG